MGMRATVAMLQLEPARDALSVASDVAVVVVAAAVVALALALMWFLRRLSRTLDELRGTVRTQAAPVSERLRAISDNVEFITAALRTDVERLNASVRALNERLELASRRMEERIEEFNALVKVVQEEAEDIFLDTAATVRGVREGARSIASGRREMDAAGSTGGREPGEAALRSPSAGVEAVED